MILNINIHGHIIRYDLNTQLSDLIRDFPQVRSFLSNQKALLQYLNGHHMEAHIEGSPEQTASIPSSLLLMQKAVQDSKIPIEKLTDALKYKLSRMTSNTISRYLQNTGRKETPKEVFNCLRSLVHDKNKLDFALSGIKSDNDKYKTESFIKKDWITVNQWLNTTSPEKVVKDIQDYEIRTRRPVCMNINLRLNQPLQKVYHENGIAKPNLSDKGKPHPDRSELVGHVDKNGYPAWSHKPEVTRNHVAKIQNGLQNLKLSQTGRQNLHSLIKHVISDPDHGVMTSGTSKGANGRFMELRIRHISNALRDGNISETPEGHIKLSQDRHSTTDKNPLNSTAWHFDGKTLKSFAKNPKGISEGSLEIGATNDQK
jgi:hypothetical protein